MQNDAPTVVRRLHEQEDIQPGVTDASSERSDACLDCNGTGVAGGHDGPSETECPACKRSKGERAALVELIRAHLRPSFQLQLSPVEDPKQLPILGTRFGGVPYAEEIEGWPDCPSCKKGLTFIGQFELRKDLGDIAQHVRLITFFYCWECMPSGLKEEPKGCWVVRPYSRPHVDRFVQIQPKEAPARVTKPCSVQCVPEESHPDWDEVALRIPPLRDLASRLAPAEPYAPYRAAAKEVVGDYAITTQLGGWGRWIQDARRRQCRTCGDALDFVLQIDSLSEAECDWGLSGMAYLLVCPRHSAEWELDIQRT